MRRWHPAVEYPLINQLSEQADPTELGGKLPSALANRLRISRAEASRRIHEAQDLGERTALNGEPLEPVLAATAQAQRNGEIGLAAPGMCNPADAEPCLRGTPSQAAIQGDTRSAGQRHHDALLALVRAALASGELGQHNGLPASIVVTTTLKELEAGCGKALTGGGSLLPMSDVIRLAGHAHHLAIFDNGKALALYHTKRLASPAQRIVLYAKAK